MKTSHKENRRFWHIYKEGKIKIVQSELIRFLNESGFRRHRATSTSTILIRLENNLVRESSEEEIIKTIYHFFISQKVPEVYEVFLRGVTGYITNKKLLFLKEIENLRDKDSYSVSRFYFLNGFTEVHMNEIKLEGYEKLPNPIWKNRIIRRNFNMPNPDKKGQFENFCWLVAKEDQERFDALKSFLGYLLHRNKERGETLAIILYDEKMGHNNQANGRTGKSLLGKAIGQCRNLVLINGKEIKSTSRFKNQLLELSTDVVLYDDLQKNYSFEQFFPELTDGIEVEKKHKPSFILSFEDSPKVLITSNYYVRGPGGSSDEGRRYEFELANYFNAQLTPEMVFGNRFFDDQWPDKEWNMFFLFMMKCVQLYLERGLVKAPGLNLEINALKMEIPNEFIEFLNEWGPFDTWQDKRVLENIFKELHPVHSHFSTHKITKWLNRHAASKGATLETNSSGGSYFFRIRKEVQDA